MKDSENSTGAGATRDGDSVSTDPALSSHTFTGSADRVALRITPRGDAAPGSVEIIDAANQPVSTTAPPEEIVVRQLYPDTIEPATAPRTPPLPIPPGKFAPAHGQGRMPGRSRVSRRAWFGIAAIIVALLAIGFLALQSFGRTSSVVLPTTGAPAIVQATATPALSVAPTLAPTTAPTLAPAPPAVLLVSTPTTPTEAPLPTVVPTEAPAPTVVPIVAPTTAPAPTAASTAATTVPTAVPPTSVPAAPATPPAPAVAPAAPVSQPALPPLPPGISPPPTKIPSVPQIPRKP